MGAIHAVPPLAVEEDEDFIEEGDWTAERREVLGRLSKEEIDAELWRQQAERQARRGIKRITVGV